MKKNISGFTLLELIVTLTIAAILLGLGLPSMLSTLKRNDVAAAIGDIGSAITTAKTEAVSRGIDVTICGSNDGATCAGSSDWSNGWIVFSDDADGTVETGIGEEIYHAHGLTNDSSIKVTDADDNGVNFLTFTPRGRVSQGIQATFKVCGRDNDVSFARAVLLERVGRAIHAFDLHLADGSAGSDNIYEDVNGDNLACP